jgi:uncharacterized protein YhbP (UPF0306 family)
MDIKELIREYLQNARVMQFATSANNKPWMCTVHFYADEDLNLYWISTPARRHSKEIEENPHVAAAILIHEDTPTEKYITGLSIEGEATLITPEEVELIGQPYIQKLGKEPKLLQDIKEGKNPHRFYRLKPSKIVLFDTKNFPDNPRQEIDLK